MDALDGYPLDLAGLARHRGALLGGVGLGHGLGAALVQPHIAVGVVALLGAEAHRVIGRRVGRGSDQDAVGIQMVAEDLLLDGQGNPLTFNLLVADESRSDKTICLAVSPSLKAMGVPSRPRLFEARQAIRLYEAQHHCKVDYVVAKPQMALYEKVSAKIY